MGHLPIDAILPELMERLNEHKSTVLAASPGAGKTTRVPLTLLDAPWLDGQRIVMLEPRRIAARSAARYMAAQLGEQVGETVGYRVRLDTRIGPKTRIEVITEGVLTRMLQSDPALEGIGIVIFDEFHERHLHSDLGLALCLQTQSLLRDDLRLLVMSATIDTASVSELLGGAPIVISEGKAYPVDTHYLAGPSMGRIEDAAARTVASAIQRHDGDALVFLPGAGEIRRVHSLLASMSLGAEIRITPLYGNLSPEAQDHAVAESAPGERKIVLSTSIAESSVTVKGVRIVVDSGLSRIPRFSPRTGMARLETVPVSAASADQRRGRAGREAPGVCYRLWSEQEHRQLQPQSDPELMNTDLAPLALELAAWGVGDPEELQWLNLPPIGAYKHAVELLNQLGALDQLHPGKLTSHGKAMAELGMHPRLSHMVLKAVELGIGAEACELAALLSDRDLLPGSRSVDVRLRQEALHGGHSAGEADETAIRRIANEASQWMRAVGVRKAAGGGSSNSCGILLAMAYPDRIAQRRGDGRFLLRSGRGAVVPELQSLSGAAYLAVAELEDGGTDSRIRLAAPITQEELEFHCAEQLDIEQEVKWDRASESVRARRRLRIGAIVLKEGPLPDPDPELVMQALMEGIMTHGIAILPWTKASRQLQARIELMHHHNPEWPDVSDSMLIDTLREWLGPYIGGMRSRADLGKLNLTSILESRLSWQERETLEKEVPTHLTVPSGSRIPVDYSNPEAPALAVRLQELFGLRQTPRIAGGKLPITIHLLSPAHRPVQVTNDLTSFWEQAYFEVKKDLKGRYPKHYWPDNPLEAAPTSRAKPRL
ncbi:ATP-dependent helicase HrpB [Paenibacillus mendelii]|uniref:ATP-dependent helicase HrpB n=1 Tax=Paenibacillus mendelii TaxID=206163 RepID=A0ABV6JGB6_9BACL|nr:ATP-dependent helicase HrpB [Paenibacillus mendelii]MCQ6557806.1 ATP-dependent helicase HrpB [Paenibacillus mendelii]